MDTKEVISPGYGLPKKKTYLEKYGFCCYWRPSSVRKTLSFFSDCLQCHKKIVKGGYHLKQLATTFLLCL